MGNLSWGKRQVTPCFLGNNAYGIGVVGGLLGLWCGLLVVNDVGLWVGSSVLVWVCGGLLKSV